MPDQRELLADALDSLERSGCQFWACDGPTLRPKPMVTCHRCVTVAKLRRALRLPVRDPKPREGVHV